MFLDSIKLWLKHVAHAVGTWLLRWTDEVVISSAPVDAAVLESFLAVGLAPRDYASTFDLGKAGQLHAVMGMAAEKLDLNHNLHTVGDVIDYLQEQR